jgi:hypothetical protein
MHLATLDAARDPEAGICPDRFDSGGVVKVPGSRRGSRRAS